MITAETWTDDYVFEIKFDATMWAKNALPEEIEDLRDCGYRGNQAADYVAQYFEESHDEIKAMFDYISLVSGTRKQTGFECSVDVDSFEDWISQNRPELALED